MKNIINKLGFLFVFLDNLYLPIDLGFDFRINYLLQLLFIIFFLLTHSKLKISSKFIGLYLMVSIFLFSVAVIKGIDVVGFLKQFVLIFFQLLYSYVLLNSYNFNLTKIVKDYMSIVSLVCWVAIVQFALVTMGYGKIADLSNLGFRTGNFATQHADRVQSWFEEPSFLAYTITPAVFIALARIFKMHRLISLNKVLLILIVVFLSKSSVGLLGFLISLIIIVFTKYPIIKKPLYLTIIIIAVPLIGFAVYSIPAVKFRVDDTYELFTNENVTKSDINNTNLSTYALYSNYRVTKEAFFQNPVLGTGIGSYENNYDMYLNKVIPKTPLRDMYHLNRMDANSLFMRLLVEGGLLLLISLIIFTFRYRIAFSLNNVDQRFFWAFNNGIFVLIIIRLLRQGHYTSLGFVLFLLLFYFLKKEVVFDERNH